MSHSPAGMQAFWAAEGHLHQCGGLGETRGEGTRLSHRTGDVCSPGKGWVTGTWTGVGTPSLPSMAVAGPQTHRGHPQQFQVRGMSGAGGHGECMGCPLVSCGWGMGGDHARTVVLARRHLPRALPQL